MYVCIYIYIYIYIHTHVLHAGLSKVASFLEQGATDDSADVLREAICYLSLSLSLSIYIYIYI